jgi:hypothetical protein
MDGCAGSPTASQSPLDDPELVEEAIRKKVFVSRVPLGTTPSDLVKAFSACGKVGD